MSVDKAIVWMIKLRLINSALPTLTRIVCMQWQYLLLDVATFRSLIELSAVLDSIFIDADKRGQMGMNECK